MAKRCPESRFIGTAILHNYRFQINQRGFANILYRRNDHVEGLLYLLSRTDKEKLDRSEGTPTAYQKHHLTVQVFTAAIAHVGRAVPELAQQLDYSEDDPTRSTESAGSHDRSRGTEQPRVHSKTIKRSSKPRRHITRDVKRNIMHQRIRNPQRNRHRGRNYLPQTAPTSLPSNSRRSGLYQSRFPR